MADLIPIMTSNSGPSGTASASTTLSATYAAWKAMDNNAATWWSTTAAGVTPSWLMYNWGAINTKIVNSYTIRARSGAGNQAGAPKDFKLQGYNGSTYTDLDSQTGQTGWGDSEVKTFSFSNTTAYQGYRLYVTANDGGTYTEIAELELLGGAAVARIELAGVQVLCKAPAVRIELAGVQVLCKAPAVRIELAGVQVGWSSVVSAYTLTVNVTGSGSVVLDPPGGSYAPDSEVSLEAVPDEGWQFDHWQDDLAGSTNPETLVMDAAKTVTAVFTEIVVPTAGQPMMLGFHF